MGRMVVECHVCHKSRTQLAARKGGTKSGQRVALTWVDGSVHKVQIVGPLRTITDHHVQSAMKRFKEQQYNQKLFSSSSTHYYFKVLNWISVILDCT